MPTTPPIPRELEMLTRWIAQHGYGAITADFRLRPDPHALHRYFDAGVQVADALTPFAHTHSGAILALWQCGTATKVVHLGSEGNHWFTIAGSFQDFLRVLAIGYPDWEDTHLPHPIPAENPFKNWVETTFHLAVPPSAQGITDKADKTFTRWLHHRLQPATPFEQFDPDSPFNRQFHSIEYRLVVHSLPPDTIKFIGDLRKVSTLSIAQLRQQLHALPLVVYQNTTYFRGTLALSHFPTPDKEALHYLTQHYTACVTLQYRDNVKQSEKKDFETLK